MGFREGGQIDPPPCISWLSSTPALSRDRVNFWKPGFKFLPVSGVYGVRSIKRMIDWTNTSFELMFIMTEVQNDNSPQK